MSGAVIGPGGTAEPPPRYLVALLAAFTSLVVLTTDVYLPVLPRLGADLRAGNAAAAATVSAVLIGIAVGQIVFGPVSDAVGRRRPLLLGAVGYAAAHVLSALAPTITVLLLARVLVGLATAACMVVGRAIIADVYPGHHATRAFATLGAVTAIAPVVAPLLGAGLAGVMSWRGMFLVLAAIALLLAAIGWRRLPETLPVHRRRPGRLPGVVQDLTAVLGVRGFRAYVVTYAGVGGLLFGYIGASSFVLQGTFGLSAQGYGLAFAGNGIGLVTMTWVTRHTVLRWGPVRLLLAGQVLALAGVAVLAVGVAFGRLPIVLPGLFLVVAGLGLVMPTATSLAMSHAPGRAGSASGVIGIVQFTTGTISAPLAGLGGSPWSFVAVLGGFAIAGLAGRLAMQRLGAAGGNP